LVVQTTPDLRVRVRGLVENPVVSTKNEIFAFEEEREWGTYPIFLAKETTFSLRVALSIKTSLLIILALYEEM
jgi:hypothetical protein